MAYVLLTMAVPDGSGAPRMAQLFGQSLVQAGHRVVAACGAAGETSADPGRPKFLADLTGCGIEVLDVPAVGQPLTPGSRGELRRCIQRTGAEVVIGFQPRDQLLGLYAARQAGVPCIVSAQTLLRFQGAWPVRRGKQRLLRWGLRRSPAVVCTSPVVLEQMRNEYGVSRRRCCLLPNAIDVDAFADPPADVDRLRAELGADEEDLLLVNVGRLHLQKAQDVLLRAFAEAAGDRPDVRLVLIGDVPECAAQREMQRYADDLRQFPVDAGLADRVRFAGWREDVPAVLAAADGYVHAARWEGWPLTVMEAMAAGVPVVFTDCAGRPPGFAEGQDGWIVPTEDVHALADRIGRMVQMSPAQRRQMGQAGRAFCRSHYDIRAVGQRFVAIVEHVLAGETDVGKQFAEGRATWPCS